jgi:hypothetical protein
MTFTYRLTRAALTALVMAPVALAACRTGAAGSQQQTQAPDPNAPVIPVYSPMAAKPGGPITPRPTGYKVDAIDFLLFPGQTVEYKFRLDKGATMLYTWKADMPVRFDFHTVPDGKPISASERFEAAERTETSGTYVAPYPGLHGWWWENPGKEPVNIRVQAAGFFTGAVMFSGTEQTPFEVKDPPTAEEP